ncbi:MAG: bifunctional phosphopantothenoylcysteine decarboxylase/phosphopantothenate--cysteine ligase CoaBC [Sneathiella sp.]|nr:bifunctional phosphopantothenoylcysteine decarboxylase/phosphopantothenate--cysteine ligase CoaBC [Sneathiella sp.]
MSQQKSVLLIIGGGIAAYKSLELIRLLSKGGVKTRAILTEAGSQFVTPLSVSALTGEKVFGDLFSLTDEAEMGHIELSRSADLVVVAPATADLMAKMANGHANDLASTTLMATDTEVLIAPAMNVRMWDHPATQRNLATLKQDGVRVVGPDEGDMACGEFGPGRLSEPAVIADQIFSYFTQKAGPLAGKSFLVTAGPTHEPIDPVRYIANRSSGKQGYAIAAELSKLGADVTLISGPTRLDAPAGVTRVEVESATDMLLATERALPVDGAVFAAAVADWRVANQADQKIKKQSGGDLPDLALAENPDILATISNHAEKRPSLVVGFAAETQTVIENAQKKLAKKACDWIVANDVSPETGTFGGDQNRVHLISKTGVEDWPLQSKADVAKNLAQRIADHFGE